MSATQDTDKRFRWIAQHGGPVVDWADSNGFHRHHVTGEGMQDWFASERDDMSRPLSLSKHVDEANGTRMLELRLATQPGAKPVLWNSTLKVSGQRYVRVSGSAADFPTALAYVEAYVHESRQLGGLTWWREADDRWISWLGVFDLSAAKITGSRDGAYWHFQVGGDAPTLEEAALLAMIGRLDMNGGAGGPAT